MNKQSTKKQRRQLYLKIAEEIGDSINSSQYICNHIDSSSIKKSECEEFLIFRPTEEERDFIGSAWFSESNLSKPASSRPERIGNELRILVLCFASVI